MENGKKLELWRKNADIFRFAFDLQASLEPEVVS